MKKTTIFMAVLVILWAASIAMAEENISGVWEDVDPMAVNAQSVYAQFGNKVHATGYFEFQGVQPCVWLGTGTINGNKVELTVIFSKKPSDPIWNGADGKYVLTLSPDGRTLSGTWYNKNGASGAKKIVKRK